MRACNARMVRGDLLDRLAGDVDHLARRDGADAMVHLIEDEDVQSQKSPGTRKAMIWRWPLATFVAAGEAVEDEVTFSGHRPRG